MDISIARDKIIDALNQARREVPLVGSITNTVTVNFVANAQLSVGASAAMVYLPDEGTQLAEMADAFYINVGTLMPIYEQAVPATAKRLHELGKPWVLDPVGIGIGSLREKLLIAVKEYKPSIIRANASETIALADMWGLLEGAKANVRGVDATDPVLAAHDAARALAQWTGGAVAVSGEQDVVVNEEQSVLLEGGSHFMEKITGSGCSLGGVCAAYAAVADPFTAALTASAAYDCAGLSAQAKANVCAPASFQVAFLDELYTQTPEQVADSKMCVL